MKHLITILAVILVGLPSTPLAGHDGLGGLSLAPAHSVRSISMGETGLVETGSVLGFGTNPASIPFLTRPGVAVGYGSQAQGLSASRTTLAGVMPLGEEVTVPGLEAVGRRFGLGFAFDHEGVELSQGSGWGTETLAAGAGYLAAPYASLGLLLKFLFSNTDVEGTRVESLPLVFSLGGHLVLPRRVSADLTVSLSGADLSKGGLGLDVPVLDTGLSLRGGYFYQPGKYSRNVPTFGLGFVYTDFELDYAARFDNDLALGTTHHFALTYRFGPGS
jgi:hypothetical protein